MAKKTVDVYSDDISYWWRWLAVGTALAVMYGMSIVLQGEAPAVTFFYLVVGMSAFAGILAFIYRPRNFQIIVEEHQLSIAKLSSGKIVKSFSLEEVRYVTVRNCGHLFNLSVLSIVVRTREGSAMFGPIYNRGVDGVTSAAVARLLPRVPKPVLTPREVEPST